MTAVGRGCVKTQITRRVDSVARDSRLETRVKSGLRAQKSLRFLRPGSFYTASAATRHPRAGECQTCLAPAAPGSGTLGPALPTPPPSAALGTREVVGRELSSGSALAVVNGTFLGQLSLASLPATFQRFVHSPSAAAAFEQRIAAPTEQAPPVLGLLDCPQPRSMLARPRAES